MARPTNTAERRTQIARALLVLLPRVGYDGASVADIAHEAGLAPGLVHYHYATKIDILVQAIDELAKDHAARVAARLEEAGADPAARLEAFIDAHLARGPSADPSAVRAWVTVAAEALRDARVRRVYARALRDLVDALARLVDEGARAKRFVCADPRRAAASIFATIQGYFVLASTARDLVPAGSAAGETRKAALALVGARAPRRRRV